VRQRRPEPRSGGYEAADFQTHEVENKQLNPAPPMEQDMNQSGSPMSGQTTEERTKPRRRRPTRRRQKLYAAHTKVPVDRTKVEIERTVTRYGAKEFVCGTKVGKAVVMFEAHDRRLRFDMPLPAGESEKEEQAKRQKWRALLLTIKAKLESVESKIETFEEAFLAHIVMPDGRTVGEHAIPTIASIYQSGQVQPLLPAPQ
jgi:hypothetical protein